MGRKVSKVLKPAIHCVDPTRLQMINPEHAQWVISIKCCMTCLLGKYT